MALAAATVVAAIVARLLPMPATAGRVFTDRAWSIDESELPAWRVTAEGEEVALETVDGVNSHALEVRVQGMTAAVAGLDAALHALAAAGLALLFAAPVPYALQLTRIERELATEGEAVVGIVTLWLSAMYFVHPANPETILST